MNRFLNGNKKLFLKIIFLPGVLILCVFLYGVLVFLGGMIPVNLDRITPSQGEMIYLLNNGYHVALALPRNSCPYTEVFDLPLNNSDNDGFFYFGWGDRQFYLGNPTVRNIDWPMAFTALFTPSPSVLEVLYLANISPNQPGVTEILVSKDELSDLYKYIKSSFLGSKNTPDQIPQDEIDQAFQGSIFFEAKRTYSLFNTCNNWTSRGLKQAGLGTHLWTPLTWGVLE